MSKSTKVRRLSSNDEDNDNEEEKEEEFELEEDNNNEFHVLQHRSNLSSMDHTNDNNDTIQSSSHQYGCEVLTFGRANHCALGVFRSSDSSAKRKLMSVHNIKLAGRFQKLPLFCRDLPLFSFATYHFSLAKFKTCKRKSGNLIGYDHTHLPLFLKGSRSGLNHPVR